MRLYRFGGHSTLSPNDLFNSPWLPWRLRNGADLNLRSLVDVYLAVISTRVFEMFSHHSRVELRSRVLLAIYRSASLDVLLVFVLYIYMDDVQVRSQDSSVAFGIDLGSYLH